MEAGQVLLELCLVLQMMVRFPCLAGPPVDALFSSVPLEGYF
jgi:hypothetical protein